jgi:tetratricopeptide (TPR) repeat protein
VDFDDRTYITENSNIQSGVTWQTVRWAMTSRAAGNWHPLTWLSHALDWQLFGRHARGHHAVSALLHAANAVVLFLLLWMATAAWRRSLFVAGLFALHPLNVECVAWAAERKSVLSTLFFLLALGAYGWYARRPSVQRYLVLATLFVLGLAAKPMVITLPCVLLLLDFWPLRRVQESTSQQDGAWYARRPISLLVTEKLPLFLLSAASAAITVLAQHEGNALVTLQQVPFWWRAENALVSYALYLWKAVLPAGLAVFYPPGFLTLWSPMAAGSVLLAISILAWRERTRKPYLLIGWLWYLGTLVPVIGIVQVGSQAMADRYAYIPLIGIFVMAAWLAADVARSRQVRPFWKTAVAAACLIALAAVTWRQIGYWRSPLDLWSRTLSVTDHNLVAEDNMGIALMDLNRDEEAIAHFQNAIRIKYEAPEAHINLGAELQKLGRLEEAIQEYRAVISISNDPDNLKMAYHNLGTAYRDAGDLEKARESYQRVLQIVPSDLNAMVALGKVEILEGAQRLAKDLRHHPTVAGYQQLGQLLDEAGKPQEAQSAYATAQALNAPQHAAAKVGKR